MAPGKTPHLLSVQHPIRAAKARREYLNRLWGKPGRSPHQSLPSHRLGVIVEGRLPAAAVEEASRLAEPEDTLRGAMELVQFLDRAARTPELTDSTFDGLLQFAQFCSLTVDEVKGGVRDPPLWELSRDDPAYIDANAITTARIHSLGCVLGVFGWRLRAIRRPPARRMWLCLCALGKELERPGGYTLNDLRRMGALEGGGRSELPSRDETRAAIKTLAELGVFKRVKRRGRWPVYSYRVRWLATLLHESGSRTAYADGAQSNTRSRRSRRARRPGPHASLRRFCPGASTWRGGDHPSRQ